MNLEILSLRLAIIALGCCANAVNGVVIAILGSLLLFNSIGETAALCLIAGVASAVAGAVQAFIVPRVPDLRNASCMPSNYAMRETVLVFVNAPLWAVIGGATGYAVFFVARTIGETTGVIGVRDITLMQVFTTGLVGTLAMCAFVGASYKLTGEAQTFFVQNHVIDMLQWSASFKLEEEVMNARREEEEEEEENFSPVREDSKIEMV